MTLRVSRLCPCQLLRSASAVTTLISVVSVAIPSSVWPFTGSIAEYEAFPTDSVVN